MAATVNAVDVGVVRWDLLTPCQWCMCCTRMYEVEDDEGGGARGDGVVALSDLVPFPVSLAPGFLLFLFLFIGSQRTYILP